MTISSQSTSGRPDAIVERFVDLIEEMYAEGDLVTASAVARS